MYDEVKAHIQEMLDLGAIRHSNSPWSSAIVLVRKKDGRLRFCIDLRKLNNRTVKDAYSLPRIETLLDTFLGSTIFTTLDLKAGKLRWLKNVKLLQPSLVVLLVFMDVRLCLLELLMHLLHFKDSCIIA